MHIFEFRKKQKKSFFVYKNNTVFFETSVKTDFVNQIQCEQSNCKSVCKKYTV